MSAGVSPTPATPATPWIAAITSAEETPCPIPRAAKPKVSSSTCRTAASTALSPCSMRPLGSPTTSLPGTVMSGTSR